MYRQGDLLIMRVDTDRPAMVDFRERGRRVVSNIVQLGEATGHAHVLEKGEVYDLHNQTYLTSTGEAQLVHNEHDTIVLPEGEYFVVRQREFSEDGAWANVWD